MHLSQETTAKDESTIKFPPQSGSCAHDLQEQQQLATTFATVTQVLSRLSGGSCTRAAVLATRAEESTAGQL